jgi:heme-binding protein
MKNLSRTIVLALCGIVAVASLAGKHPSGNTGAPLLEGADVPRAVRATIDRACRDCHSEATRYPWYSYVAPVSWLIDGDVRRGRERLNFSKWSDYPVIRRERCLSEIANQVQDGGMPLTIYTLLHRNAKLTQADVQAMFEWTQAERMRLITGNAAVTSSR